jgi:hypothetical protein
MTPLTHTGARPLPRPSPPDCDRYDIGFMGPIDRRGGRAEVRRTGWQLYFTDAAQNRLRTKLRALTHGDFNRPIVAVGWNAERFNGRNLALRLAALGYKQVYWYRGGREAWEVHGMPETNFIEQEW